MPGVIRKRKSVKRFSYETKIMVPKVVLEDCSGMKMALDPITSSPAPMKNSKENGSTGFSNGLLKFAGGQKFHGNENSAGENFELEDRIPLLAEEDEEKGEDGDESPLERSISTAEESAWVIALQVCFPYLIAGCGTVGAGLVLDRVQHWDVFSKISEIFILVPALLGLKGNLEMTLASRLSTQANLGHLDTKGDQLRESIANLALIEAQAMVVAFLASMFATVLGWVPKGSFSLEHALILCASSMITAFAASLILSVIMIFVILCSRRLHINPDNVATPIAASLGDLTTLTLLALAATWLNETSIPTVPLIIVALFIALTPIFAAIAWRNPLTKVVLLTGWSPVIFSMLISSAGGFILDVAVMRFHGLAVFQPVINGIGGNLVAVQASRLSTSLHKEAPGLGILPDWSPRGCPNPCAWICGAPGRAARVLLALVVPGHLIFMYMIHYLNAGHTAISPLFVIVYLSAALLQVAVLLYICAWMVHKMWFVGVDPDNSAIPYLTALGDLFGTALLAVAFQILYLFTGKDSKIRK